MLSWVEIEISQIWGILLSTLLCYAALIVIVRINGLRSFAKISGHDFAVTVAIGSILASTVVAKDPAVAQGALAIAALMLWRTIVSYIRMHVSADLFDNKPLLVMRDGKILEENLKKSNFTKSDLYGKLREANVLNIGQVRAVVIEPTGDFSVLHGDAEDFDDDMLYCVDP